MLELILDKLNKLERVPPRDAGDQPQGDVIFSVPAQHN